MTDQRSVVQNRAMWGLVAQLARATGGTRDDATQALRASCRTVAGHEHTSQLTTVQADRVLKLMRQRLQQLGKQAQAAPTAAPRATGTITPRQQAVLTALFRQVGFSDRARQMGFCKRQCRTPWPQTQVDFDRLMESLKAMAVRKVRPADAWRRAKKLLNHPKLDAWQRQFVPDLVRQFQAAEQSQTLDKVLSPHKLLKLVEAEVACGVAA